MANAVKSVLTLLMMPPPVHGASAINKKMVDFLRAQGCTVDSINLVPSEYIRFFDGPVWKLLRAFVAIYVFLQVIARWFYKPNVVYFGISGGFGLIYDCLIALAVRVLNIPVFVHHHSFSYINKRSLLFYLLCWLLGKKVTHIVLCEEMGALLHQGYRDVVPCSSIFVLSNAAFFDEQKKMQLLKKTEFTLGYISNITLEKGIAEFVALYSHCLKLGLDVTAKVAGPCANPEIQKLLADAEQNLKGFSYIGSVYGDQKLEFFQCINVLVFPTNYINEAEPLIIYEAAEQGVPTVTFARGCISFMVQQCGGLAIDVSQSFSEPAIAYVRECVMEKSLYVERCRLAILGVALLRNQNKGQLNSLLERMFE